MTTEPDMSLDEAAAIFAVSAGITVEEARRHLVEAIKSGELAASVEGRPITLKEQMRL